MMTPPMLAVSAPMAPRMTPPMLVSWEFGDSSHGVGIMKGLDGVRQWVRLEIVPTETPRFTQVHGPPTVGKTPTSCLVSYYLDSGYNAS
jgi:hypothetical protein